MKRDEGIILAAAGQGNSRYEVTKLFKCGVLVVRRWFRISGRRMWENEIWWISIVNQNDCGEDLPACVGLNVVYWLSGVGSAQAASAWLCFHKACFRFSTDSDLLLDLILPSIRGHPGWSGGIDRAGFVCIDFAIVH